MGPLNHADTHFVKSKGFQVPRASKALDGPWKGVQYLQGGSKGFASILRPSEVSKAFEVLPRAFKGFQGLPSVSKGLRKLTTASKAFEFEGRPRVSNGRGPSLAAVGPTSSKNELTSANVVRIRPVLAQCATLVQSFKSAN